MADDNVAIAAPATPATQPANVLIKTFTTDDPNRLVVEVQAVSLVSDTGRTINPLTEDTGREIVHMLRRINNILADSTGVGAIVALDDN